MLNSVQESTLTQILHVAREQRDLQAQHMAVSQQHLAVQKDLHRGFQDFGRQVLKFLASPLGIIMAILAIIAVLLALPPAIDSSRHLLHRSDSPVSTSGPAADTRRLRVNKSASKASAHG